MGKAKDFMEILDNLAIALGDSEGQTPEEIRRDIEDEGFQYQQMMSRLKENVNIQLNQLRRSALDEARQQRLRTDSSFRAKLAEFAGLGREKKLAGLKDLLDQGFLAPTLAYRDLSEESEQDLVSLYEDAELARLIAEQRKQDE